MGIRPPILTLVPLGGICNRMRAIDSALSLASKVESELRVLWCLDADVGSRFETLWRLPDSIAKLVQIEARNASGRLRKKLHSWFLINSNDLYLEIFPATHDENCLIDKVRGKRVVISTGHRFCNTEEPYNNLVPADEITRLVDLITEDFDNVVGVHIRRTDNAKSTIYSPTHRIIALMREELEKVPETRFFAASDDPDEVRTLERCFPERIISYPKRSLMRHDSQAIVDALVDLYCLSRCRKLIGSYWSSFSETAWQIRGIEHEIVNTRIAKNDQ